MNIIFMGTPEFSVLALEALHAAHRIVCVYTQPPRPAGRGKKDRPTPVHARALELGLPVRHPARLKSPEDQAEFAALDADVAVVVAYGLILPQPVLDAPRLGCVNIHASLLPRWRGAAPIHRAILAGDAETGVCIMRMEAGLDTGPVIGREATPIGPDDTTASLHDRLARMGADGILRALQGDLTATPQPEEGVTYAAKIDKAEARIDWTRPATEIDRQIRGLSPFPGAWCLVGEERLKLLASRLVVGPEGIGQEGAGPEGAEQGRIGQECAEQEGTGRMGIVGQEGAGRAAGAVLEGLTIACGTGAVQITLAQREGKRPMTPGDLLRGWTLPERLG